MILDLKISNLDVCLSSVIYYMHKNKKEIYISKVIEEHLKIYKKIRKNTILKRIRMFKKAGLIGYEYKKVKSGQIPIFIKVTDRFLMFHKLLILITLLRHDKKQFDEVAERMLEKMLQYIKKRKEEKNENDSLLQTRNPREAH